MTTTNHVAATATRPSVWKRIAYVGRRAVQLEIAGYRSLYRYVFRRPRVPAGATAFTYHKPVQLVITMFIVGSVIEVAVADLIVHRWPVVRIPVLIVGVWGLIWMLGMLFGYLTRPHAVGPDGIRARQGAEIDIALAWDDIDEIALRKHAVEGMAPQFAERDDGGGTIVALPIQDETAIDIVLARPMHIRLPQRHTTISEVRIAVDDPRGFLDAARPYFTSDE